MNTNEMRPAEAMLQMISGFWVSRCIYVAAQLGLADLIKDEPKTVEEMAAATTTHAPSLYRLLRALASVGVFAEREDGRFVSTPLAATLRADAPDSLRALVASELGEGHYQSWGELLYSVKTGDVAFEHLYQMPLWQYYARNPERARLFDESMTNFTKVVEPAILAAYDFSKLKRIVDVGGGHGSLLAAILKRDAHLKGIVYDAPQVVAGAQARLADAGLSDRCEAIGGDFFASVPDGGDAYMMKHIIHDWEDERCVTLLKNCHRVMPEDGKLLVIEQVVPPGNAPSFGKFTDLIMMVMVGGRERTSEEFDALFAKSNFKLNRIVQTQSPVCIIEGVKA